MSYRRITGLCTVLCMLLCAMLCRVFWISTDITYAASAGQQTVRETDLPRARGDFYDRTGRLLTGYVRHWYALCVPGDANYAELFPYVPYAQQVQLYENRNAARPFLVEVQNDLTLRGIPTYEAAARTLPLPIAEHLLGYLDGEGHGVAGLEYAYEDVLAASNAQQSVVCTTNAQGALLAGTEPKLQTLATGNGLGVQLALDADIQRLCEGIADLYLPRGCILVMDTASGHLLASVSRPAFSPGNIAASIAANDTSLINRSLSAFTAGSVFKVVPAVAAYQNGLDWFTHECTGSVTVAGQVYRCAGGRAHGTVNLRAALAESCNCYFIELGQVLGGAAVLDTAQRLGFGTPCAVAPGLKSAAGALPEPETLENVGQQAIFSFGQGALTVTPLQITAMMNTVAADGIYKTPRLVLGTVDENLQPQQGVELPPATRVCSAEIAKVLRSMLQTVVEEGIGQAAQPSAATAAGKTGTAQTGQFNEAGEELLNYWFSGFTPAENPRYTITVLQDGVLDPETSSAAIFAKIADSLRIFDGENG